MSRAYKPCAVAILILFLFIGPLWLEAGGDKSHALRAHIGSGLAPAPWQARLLQKARALHAVNQEDARAVRCYSDMKRWACCRNAPTFRLFF